MEAERKRLSEHRQGKLRRALGVALPGEEVEQLDHVGEQDRRRAEEGLLAVKDAGGGIYFKHIDDLRPQDMEFRTEAEWVEVEWLKERVRLLKEGREGTPPIPEHLL